MKVRSVKVPQSVRDVEWLLADPEVRRARDTYAAFLRGEAGRPHLGEFDSPQVEAIVRLALKKNGEPFDERQFAKKMHETRRLVVQPRTEDKVADLWRTLAQPEILQDLWPSIDPRTGARGQHPGISGKSLLFSAAMLGHSPHLNATHHLLSSDRRLQNVYTWVEQAAAAVTGTRPHPFETTTYEQAARQEHAIAAQLPVSRCISTNIKLVKEVHKLLGVKKVRLSIDGTSVPAWVEQTGKQNEEREARICRVATNAKPRALTRGNGGFVKFWRGYYLIALVDLATGLPLTWVLWPADADEAKALKALLYSLYEEWPDLLADVIVGDGAWNEAWAAEWCIRNYGLHLVAPRQASQLNVRYDLDPHDYPNISAIFGDGCAICRKHDIPLIRDGYESPSRHELKPGHESRSRAHRLRFHCLIDEACGRPGLPMELHWPALSYFPHSLAAGDAALHAERLALGAQRNYSESLNSALKRNNKLALAGAARTSTAKEPTVKARISLALVQRSARMLAQLRIEHGLFTDDLPPDLDPD